MQNQRIPLIIPAYEPDERLIDLLEELKRDEFTRVVVVDDGSGKEYQSLFARVKAYPFCEVLCHEQNQGKGRALKTAFAYCLNSYPDMIGVVTADSDGQHTPADICLCMKAMEENPKQLIMGVRDFSGEDVPWKSSFGNGTTRLVCKLLCGVAVSDTQTGLRGIPRDFMAELLSVAGERFEFETNMLIESKGKYPIKEVTIQTIYESKEHHQTHFHPFKDSIKIYRIFGKMLLKFILSSLSSSVIDLGLFTLFCFLLKPVDFSGVTEVFGGLSRYEGVLYVTVAAVAARLISATYNYLMNYCFVFKSKEHKGKALGKYVLLAAIQMSLSAGLVTLFVFLLPFLPELLIKIVIDVILFIISYWIQREIVFKA